MGRKRTRSSDKNWPKGWYLNGNVIYFKLAKYKDILGPKPIRLGATEREAYKSYAELPIHADAAFNLGGDALILNNVLNRYQVEVLPLNAPRTQENKRYYIQILRDVAGHINVELLRLKHARQFYNALKLKKGLKTAREVIGCLRHVLTMCVEWGYLDQNKIMGMKMEKPKSRRRYVTDEELDLFVAKYATTRIKAHIAVKLLTGMDKQDILLIQHQDLMQIGLRHNRHKTEGDDRIYEWTPELRAAIEQLKQAYRKKRGDIGSKFICKTRTGEPYFPGQEVTRGKSTITVYLDEKGHPFGAPSGWNSQWQRCMAKWKADGYQPFHEHDIRKKVASDTSLKNAQELLGHSDPRTTETIYRVKPKVIKLEKPSDD